MIGLLEHEDVLVHADVLSLLTLSSCLVDRNSTHFGAVGFFKSLGGATLRNVVRELGRLLEKSVSLPCALHITLLLHLVACRLSLGLPKVCHCWRLLHALRRHKLLLYTT